MCVCVCVCVRERDRERARERVRESVSEKVRERVRERETERRGCLLDTILAMMGSTSLFQQWTLYFETKREANKLKHPILTFVRLLLRFQAI